MLTEEEFKCVQLLRYALDVVQTIHANNDLDAVEALLELLDALYHRFFFEVLFGTARQFLADVQNELNLHR